MSAKIMKKEFQINVGCIDSFVRIFVGISFLCAALTGVIGFWGIAGGALVVTGLARYSPTYQLLKFNTIGCEHNAD